MKGCIRSLAPSSINYQKEWAMQRCLDETNLADLILVPSDYVKETLIENGVGRNKDHNCSLWGRFT